MLSPLDCFREEFVEFDHTAECETERLFDLWRQFCHREGHVAGSKSLFTQRLRKALPKTEVAQERNKDGTKQKVYRGIRLNEGAVKAFRDHGQHFWA